MNKILILAQLILIISLSPLISGLITKIKNNLRMRQGPGLLQPYYNFIKLFSKAEVVSENASWIFSAAPFIVFASTLTASLLIPVFCSGGFIGHMGDFLAIVFILALGRFFITLAGLDTASAFGGMGSSREMFISSLAEPALCLVIFALSLTYGTTNLGILSGLHAIHISTIVSATALFLVIIAETARLPIDNQETHLELTMVHEAMVLEYSGRRLALIELSSYIKQMIWFVLLANILFPLAISQPFSFAQFTGWVILYVIRIAAIALITAVLEVSLAKMRLLRVADFFTFAFVLGVLSVVAAILGV